MILNKSLLTVIVLTGGGICLNNPANAVTLYSCKPCTTRDPFATNCNPITGKSTSCKSGYTLNSFSYCIKNTTTSSGGCSTTTITRNTLNCRAGYYNSYSGGCSPSYVCKQCSPGTYSKGGYITSCTTCENGTYQANYGGCACNSCSEMRVYYGYATKYTKEKTTSKLKWNTVYTCGNDFFGDPYKGHSKYCAEDTHKKAAKWYMNSGIGIGEGGKFQVVCNKTTGEKCIYDGNGVMKKCVSKNYTW